MNADFHVFHDAQASNPLSRKIRFDHRSFRLPEGEKKVDPVLRPPVLYASNPSWDQIGPPVFFMTDHYLFRPDGDGCL